MKLEALTQRGEALHRELGSEYYLTGAGLKAKPAFQEIYDRFADLTGDEALQAARESGSATLLEWIVDLQVSRGVAEFDERQLLWEQDATVTVDNREVSYLRVPIELANMPDRAMRCQLDAERARIGAAVLTGLRRDRFGREYELVEGVGLGRYVDAKSTLSAIDLDALGSSAGLFLDQTADMYHDSLARFSRRRLGVPIGELTRSDTAWLFRADGFDAAFPVDGLVERATRQMQDMGLDASQNGRVQFDTEERQWKQPRAFCVSVRVPEEVYLVLRPRGGHYDYRAFWHELGHAMHFASVDPSLPFAAKWVGDNSVTEGFAMLWDHLTMNPGWLRLYAELSTSEVEELTFELAVGELFFVRRYAAELRYELELHRGLLADPGPTCVDYLTSATRFTYLPEDALLDVDPGFYVARYLRAWQLEAMLAAALTDRYDEDWYRNPGAGEFVQALMQRGQADPADRLAADVAERPLGFEQIVERFERLLT